MDETTEGMRKALANAHGLYSIQGRRERAMRAYHRQTCCTLCCQPRFWLGDVPRKYHMRRKVHLVLTNSRLGTTWDVLQTIASVVACALYVLPCFPSNTYALFWSLAHCVSVYHQTPSSYVLSTYRVGHQLVRHASFQHTSLTLLSSFFGSHTLHLSSLFQDADKVLTLFFAVRRDRTAVAAAASPHLFAHHCVLQIDYVIRWYSARSRCWYPFGGMAIIDLITIVPTLIEWISGRSYEGFHFLRFARVLRIMRILRAFKVRRTSSTRRLLALYLTNNTHTQVVNNSFDPVSRQITKLVITIASIVFLTAGLIHLVRAPPRSRAARAHSLTHSHLVMVHCRLRMSGMSQDRTQWSHLETVCTLLLSRSAQVRPKSATNHRSHLNNTTVEHKQTITHTLPTVGYGDISPDGTEGKIVVAVMIVVVIVFVPMQVGELTNLLAARSPFTARVSAGATPHALLIGNLSNVNVVRVGAPLDASTTP